MNVSIFQNKATRRPISRTFAGSTIKTGSIVFSKDDVQPALNRTISTPTIEAMPDLGKNDLLTASSSAISATCSCITRSFSLLSPNEHFSSCPQKDFFTSAQSHSPADYTLGSNISNGGNHE